MEKLREDRKLAASVAIAAAVCIVLLVAPLLLAEKPRAEVEVLAEGCRPNIVRLTQSYRVKIRLLEPPTSDIRVEVYEYVSNRTLESTTLPGGLGPYELEFKAEEGKYSIGLHSIRVEWNSGGRRYLEESFFTVIWAELDATMELSQTELEAEVEANTTANFTVTIQVKVVNKLTGSPLKGVNVRIVADEGEVHNETGVTDENGVYTALWNASFTPNATKTISIRATAFKRGYSIDTCSAEIKVSVTQKPSGEEKGG
ncbi:MAG: hypothetical protein DRN96_02035 [Thermoproteota archaeon]|nr:MAG: hypothetical protein DRN96_02035 [Candidatus Korarchaeota archaeon]